MAEDDQRGGPASPPSAPTPHGARLPARTSSRALLGGAHELIIEHKGRDYRLRVTRQGNLILTA